MLDRAGYCCGSQNYYLRPEGVLSSNAPLERRSGVLVSPRNLSPANVNIPIP
jgi:hypothetical protein